MIKAQQSKFPVLAITGPRQQARNVKIIITKKEQLLCHCEGGTTLCHCEGGTTAAISSQKMIATTCKALSQAFAM